MVWYEREIGEPWVKIEMMLLFARNNLSYPLEAPVSDEIARITELGTELNVPENASEIRKVLAVNETKSISISDFNIDEEYPSVKEVRALDGKNVFQQEVKNSNENTKWTDHDYTDVDLIAEDSGTDEPSVKTSKEVPRKGINEEAPTKAREGLNPDSKKSTLEERFKSEKTCKEVGIGDTPGMMSL